MKKIIIAVLSLLITPTIVLADTHAENLTDTLERAAIEISIDDYEEKDDQVMLYFFYSDTCGFCHNELEFINSKLADYKDKIKMRSFEVSNEDNDILKTKITGFLKVKAPNVPFLVIGESTFYGFDEETTGEKILTAIDQEYDIKKEDRYDVIDEMENARQTKSKKNNTALYIFAALAVIAIVITTIYMIKKD